MPKIVEYARLVMKANDGSIAKCSAIVPNYEELIYEFLLEQCNGTVLAEIENPTRLIQYTMGEHAVMFSERVDTCELHPLLAALWNVEDSPASENHKGGYRDVKPLTVLSRIPPGILDPFHGLH